MLDDFQPIGSMVDQVKGTTNFFAGLISRKFGLVCLFIVLGVIVSTWILN